MSNVCNTECATSHTRKASVKLRKKRCRLGAMVKDGSADVATGKRQMWMRKDIHLLPIVCSHDHHLTPMPYDECHTASLIRT